MIRMTPGELAHVSGATLLVEGTRQICGEVVLDSRKAVEGTLFVAFVGEHVDGNSYLASAAEKGAAAVALSAEPSADQLERARELGCTVVRAEGDDCEELLLRLAAHRRLAHPEWLVVGVTGSVGKTTTKDMLACGIGSGRRTFATSGNFNNLIGMPLTVLSAPEDSQVLVLEMGMNHPHEIDRMAAAARPTLAVITNVGTSHIGLLGSRENIARAKAEIVSGMAPACGVDPCLTLTSAGDYTAYITDRYARPAGVSTMLVGEGDADSVRAEGVRLGEDGRASLTVACADGWSREVTLSVPGRQAVPDFLLAMAVVWQLGLDRDAAAEAIAQMPAATMRLSVLAAPSGARVIDDSYNASPSSMAAALDVLCEMRCEGRRIAVLGEMGELGDQERRLHGYVGAYAAAKPIDMLVLVGGYLAGEMAEAARTMGYSEDKIVQFPTVQDALATLGPVIGQGDLVLAKASRSAGLDAFVKGVVSR